MVVVVMPNRKHYLSPTFFLMVLPVGVLIILVFPVINTRLPLLSNLIPFMRIAPFWLSGVAEGTATDDVALVITDGGAGEYAIRAALFHGGGFHHCANDVAHIGFGFGEIFNRPKFVAGERQTVHIDIFDMGALLNTGNSATCRDGDRFLLTIFVGGQDDGDSVGSKINKSKHIHSPFHIGGLR